MENQMKEDLPNGQIESKNQSTVNENTPIVTVDIKKVLEWVLYGLGIILVIISLKYFFDDLELRSSGNLYEFKEESYVGGDAYNFIISAARSSAIMAKGVIMAILGCTSIIVGRLTAIINKMK